MRFRGTSTPVISTFTSRKCMINYPEVSSPDWITNSPVQTYLLSTGMRDMSNLSSCAKFAEIGESEQSVKTWVGSRRRVRRPSLPMNMLRHSGGTWIFRSRLAFPHDQLIRSPLSP
jgi:hypothetical protein